MIVLGVKFNSMKIQQLNFDFNEFFRCKTKHYRFFTFFWGNFW